MGIFTKLTGKVNDAKGMVTDKAKKTALINSYSSVITSERAKLDDYYLALGKYYYNNLRNKQDEVTEPTCLIIEDGINKIYEAREELRKIYNDEIEKQETVENEEEVPVE